MPGPSANVLLQPIGVVRAGIAVTITLEAFIEDGRQIAGIYGLKGRVRLGPKAWLRAVRDEVRKLENIARKAGCVEMRIAGRDWSRVLPDYEPMTDAPDVRNGLRKAL